MRSRLNVTHSGNHDPSASNTSIAQNRNEIGRHGDSPRRTGVKDIDACTNPFHTPPTPRFLSANKKSISKAHPVPKDNSARFSTNRRNLV
jgi:hypothetical protein